MEYFVAKREYTKRRIFNGHEGKLISIYILINIYLNTLNGISLYDILGMIFGVFLILLVVFDKVTKIESHEILTIEIVDNSLNVLRNGSIVFCEKLGNVKKAWLEPASCVPQRVVFELKNYNQHVVKLPFFCKRETNRLKDLVGAINSYTIV